MFRNVKMNVQEVRIPIDLHVISLPGVDLKLGVEATFIVFFHKIVILISFI